MPMPPHLVKALEAKRLAKEAGVAKAAAPALVVSKPKPTTKTKPAPAAPLAAVPQALVPSVVFMPPRVKVSRLSLVEGITSSLAKTLQAEIMPASRAINIPGVIPTGCATVDAAIGRGGVPFSRLTILTGGEGGGKTTTALELCAYVQNVLNGIAMYIDAERKLDLDYARSLGCNTDEMIISYPASAEQGFKIMDGTVRKLQEATAEKRDPKTKKLLQAKQADIPIIIILDSINALLSEAQEEVDYGEAGAGLGSQARAFSDALPKFLRCVSGRMVAPVFISQHRAKINSYGGGKEKVAGGNAVKFYAALILDIVRTGNYRKNGAESGPFIGSELEVTPIKNQIAKPFQQAKCKILWGSGYDKEEALLQRALDLGLLNRASGGWYEMPWEDKGKPLNLKWQGLGGYRATIKKRPEVAAYILQKHLEKFATMPALPPPVVPDLPPELLDETPEEEAPAEE